MPITCLGSAVFLDRGLELGRLVGGEIMSNNRVVANLCRLLIILCVSGCAVTHRMSAKEQSYSIAMQILREYNKPETFTTIKTCNDVDALRIVVFAANAAAWPMEAGAETEFDEGMDDMLIMALDRLFAIDSDAANDTIEYYKRAFPPDGAYAIFFEEWEKRRKISKNQEGDSTRRSNSL